MIIKKLKGLINEFRNRNDKILVQTELLKVQNNDLILGNKELEWANIYHDTIRGMDWLKNISISPGRWAGNYSFFYILVRILNDCKPRNIIEFGLGESSKIISGFLDNQLIDSTHTIIEHDKSWMDTFVSRFNLGLNSKILHLPLEIKNIKEFEVSGYSGLENKVTDVFDLYVVDGPIGSSNFSRYDICSIAKYLTKNDEFIILIDDYNRNGEQKTADELLKLLSEKDITTFRGYYWGTKTQIIITTQRYRFAISL